VLHTFTGLEGDGANPFAGLIIDKSGNLYGTTYGGGYYQLGTVFKIAPNGTETVLNYFTGLKRGEFPEAGLLMDKGGSLYGTTEKGGSDNLGTLFEVSPNGQEKALLSFDGYYGGAAPVAGLIADSSGNLYGTAPMGGLYNLGVVFKLTNK